MLGLGSLPSERDGNGCFHRDRGQVRCTADARVGIAPEHSHAPRIKSSEKSNGNLTNNDSPHTTSECTGPGNSKSEAPFEVVTCISIAGPGACQAPRRVVRLCG